jgi:hypothetical protein
MNLDFHDKFKDVIIKMEKAGNSYAEAKGQSWQAQELKYTVLSSIMNNMKDVAVTARESLAKGHPDYVAYVKETSELIKAELKFKCEYEKWKNSFEALRSLSSLEKYTQNQLGD